MIVMFCGHSQFTGTAKLEERLAKILSEKVGDEPAEFFLGEYGGFDSFAYQCCKAYQRNHPHTKLIFITPYITAEYQKNHLEYQKTRYDEIIYPEIEDKPKRFAISYRNKWMAERADLVIAFVDHSYGGAYQTYRHALKMKKETINLSYK